MAKETFKVSGVSPEIPFRSGILSMGAASLSTPIKAINVKRYITGVSVKTKENLKHAFPTSFNEIYLKIGKNYNSIVRSVPIKANEKISLFRMENSINSCILGWEVKEQPIPQEKDIDRLFSIQTPYTDVLIPPLVKALRKLKSGDEDKLINVEKNYFELAETISTKSSNGRKMKLGYMPVKTSLFGIEKIVSFFQKSEVDGLVIDFGGSTSTGAAINLAHVINVLSKAYKKADNPLLYAINSHMGIRRAKTDRNIKPAKDILLYDMGFDVVGNNYIPRYVKPDTKEQKFSGGFEKTVRENWLLNCDDYGYHSTGEKKQATLLENWRIFRKERTVLEDKSKDEKLLDYLGSKEYVDKRDISNIKRLGRYWSTG